MSFDRVNVRDVNNTPLVQQAVERRLDGLEIGTGPYIVTHNYTFKDTDTIDSLQVDATTGPITIILPTPNGNRRRRVIKTDATGNVVTVSAGANLIDGASTYTIPTRYIAAEFEPTGTTWLVVTFYDNTLSSSTSAVGSSATSRSVSLSTNVSLADSDAISSGVRASSADSGATSKNVSQSSNVSTTDSKVTSIVTLESNDVSVATSKDTSQSVLISTLTSRVSSKGG